MRTKWTLVLIVAAAGAAALLAGTQPWVSFSLAEGNVDEAVTGHAVNPALSPVAIAAIIAALVISLAGRVFRWVLSTLIVLLGVGICWGAWAMLGDPIRAVRSRVAELTGLTGSVVDAEVTAVATPWPVVTIALGALICIGGLAMLVTSRRWRTSDRRYRSTAERHPQAAVEPDRISDWDALSDGEDPT